MEPALPVVAVTSSHMYEGTIAVHKRLQDVLNEPVTDFVRVDGVSVVRLTEPNLTVRQASSITLTKAGLAAALIATDAHEDPKSRVTYRAPKAAQRVFLVSCGFEIEGQAHLSRPFDSSTEAVTLEMKNFFAVTDVRLSFTGVDDEPLQVPVALVNRDLITAVSFD